MFHCESMASNFLPNLPVFFIQFFGFNCLSILIACISQSYAAVDLYPAKSLQCINFHVNSGKLFRLDPKVSVISETVLLKIDFACPLERKP